MPPAPNRLTRRLARLCTPAVLSLAAQGTSAAAGLASFAALARLLPPDAFGAWLVALTLASLGDMLRRGLLKTAFVRLAASAPDDACPGDAPASARLTGTTWALGLAVTAGLALLALAVAAGTSGPARLLAVMAGAWLVASWPMEAALWRAEAASRFGRVVALQGGAAGGFALAVGALALAGPGDMLAGSGGVVAGAGDALGAVAASYVGVATLASGVGVALGWSGAGSLPRASRREARAMLGFGRYSVGTLLGTSLLQNADTLLLGWWLGPGAVAVYGVAQKVVRVAQIPLRALAATAFPAMSRLRAQGDRTALLAFAERWTGTFTLALAPALVLLALFADAAVTLVGGAGYPEAAAVVRVFALYLALLPLDRALGLLLDALGRPRANLAKVLAMGLANAALDVGVLAAGGGVVGVAAVTLATMGVGAALGLRFVRRALPFSLGATARAGWRCVTRLRVSGA